MQSYILGWIIEDMDDQGAFSDLNIPKAWAVFMFAMAFLIVHYFPHSDSWVPTADWIITPISNMQSKFAWAAFLIAGKVEILLNSPEVDYEKLQAVLAFLTELIRWLRRLNFCFSFVVAHLNSINYWAADTCTYNHQECEQTTLRLLEYCRTIERRLDINVVDGALG